MSAKPKAPWVGKMRLGMAALEGTTHEGRPGTSTHAYIIVATPDGDSWMHTTNNPNPIMLCGIQETVGWEDEGEQNDGMPTCSRCEKSIMRRVRGDVRKYASGKKEFRPVELLATLDKIQAVIKKAQEAK